ncbi:Metal_dependent phosphohydrolase [Hexamita inflata]|uniref:Putative n=1 Tax=Hexamita inflata TaxID=28002 RepID=A0AA86P276_9EUKA|nr:Metal dependent phosphohydrolase [Hexamita inflata]
MADYLKETIQDYSQILSKQPKSIIKTCEIFAAQQPEMKELFDEYEANTTQEAKFVHDCDKLDMLIQAWIYEQQQGVKLDQFFEHCDLPKSFDVLIQVRKEIERSRAK